MIFIHRFVTEIEGQNFHKQLKYWNKLNANSPTSKLNFKVFSLGRIVLLFSLPVILFGCREFVTDEFPDFEARTAVNSILTPDKLVEIHMSKATKVDRMELMAVENAYIQLLVNGEFSENLIHTSDGKYRSIHKVLPGNEYACIVETVDLPVASANCKIPFATSLNEVILYEGAWVNDEGWLCPAIQFSIDNPNAELRYYNARIKVLDIVYQQEGVTYQIDDDISLDLFSNEFEDDPTITKYFEFFHDNLSFSEFAYVLELRSLSFDLYVYMKSVIEYEKGRYPEFDSGSIVPQNLHNNVDGGYGIFAGYSTVSSDTLSIED